MKIGTITGLIILSATLLFLYGLSLLSYLFPPEEIDISPLLLITSLLINMVILCGSSLLGNMLFYSSSLYISFKKLFFTKKKIGYSLFIGFFSALITLFILGILFYFLSLTGFTPPENPLGEQIMESLTVPLLFIVPLLSSVSEEIFFRGFLQPKIIHFTTPPLGIIITSILFGIAHISYGNPLQVIIPFFIGILFGVLIVKTKNIIAPITAHYFFNFIQLTLTYFS
jgi:membrane protease YdiL (CAAX protease family)